MADEERILPKEEETPSSQTEKKPKSMLQLQKESWYEKLPLSLKQLDLIVTVCWILIFVAVIVIALDAMNIFNPFGY